MSVLTVVFIVIAVWFFWLIFYVSGAKKTGKSSGSFRVPCQFERRLKVAMMGCSERTNSLIAHEQKRIKNLSRSKAAEYALERLERDRR